MGLFIKKDYQWRGELKNQGIICKKQAEHTLRIGIINLMPKAEEYEFNLLRPLGLSDTIVEPVFIKLKNHIYSSSDKNHLNENYITFSEAARKNLHGLILSPAPVEGLDFTEVTYWEELLKILAFARKNYASVLGLCWGGLVLARLLGIKKIMYENKLFGVYESKNLNINHPITGSISKRFFCPQSRHAGVSQKHLMYFNDMGIINLLAYCKDAGYFIFETPDHKFVMNLAHPEYHTTRLIEEYQRDMKKGRDDVLKPVNIDISNPVNTWEDDAISFFTQWVEYIKNITREKEIVVRH
ncbi:homoserine O-succinyltransferase [Candidatus Woesearchaeota archaeon]|nr:homoserine O-succinyltransferase [Candidatus Woesearchaeota archaeon]